MSLRHLTSTTAAPPTKPSSIHFGAALAALATFFAAVTGAPEAAACDCAPPDAVEPSPASKQVPSNTKVWVLQLGCETPTLQKSDGTPVSASMTKLDRARVLHPDAELEVGASYNVIGCFFDGPISTFLVTAGPDNEPPAKPSVSTLDAESGSGGYSSCGEYEHVPLLTNQTDTIVTLDIGGGATLDPEAVSGEVADVFFPSQQAVVGNTVCGPFNWSFSEDGDAVDTRLGAFDYAGNFSGWSEPETVSGDCGCEVVGAEPGRSPGYGIALLGLLALGAARRRRD